MIRLVVTCVRVVFSLFVAGAATFTWCYALMLTFGPPDFRDLNLGSGLYLVAVPIQLVVFVWAIRWAKYRILPWSPVNWP